MPDKAIIWDWNGTLLDDIQLSMESINMVLKKRNLPQLNIESYRTVFGFPIKDYYLRLGMDFTQEPFSVPAQEFIDEYYNRVKECSLHPYSTEILFSLKEKGYRQFVLSAMEQSALEQTLDQHNILSFFDDVAGLDNHFAASKLEAGKNLFHQQNLHSATTCFIGDTIHDWEVASNFGCPCILTSMGHQSEQMLKKTGATVIRELQTLPNKIKALI